MYRSKTRRLAMLLAIVALLVLALAPASVAAVDRRSGDRVVIGANETITGDLLVTAATVIIDGRVVGDVVAVAQTIEINGVIEGDLLAGGGGVILNGTVTDDVRVAAAIVRLDPQARIGDTLLGTGASIEMLPGSVMGGSLIFGGMQALLSGRIDDDVVFAGNSLLLRGFVGGNVEAIVDSTTAPTWISQMRVEGIASPPSAPAGLTVDREARIGGDLMYTNSMPATIPAGVVAGQVRFTEEPRATSPQPTIADWLLDVARRFAGLFLLGLILVWLAPRILQGTAGELETRPIASLGWGVVSILAVTLTFTIVTLTTVVAAIMLSVVKLSGLMGIIVATGVIVALALVVLTILAAAYIVQIVVGFEVGRQILLRTQPAWVERPYAPLAVGLMLLVVLAALPGIGWSIGLVTVLLGLGALWMFGRDSFTRQPILTPAPS
ncbi:bactofilin family protein [Roseiflexus sp.]|uniref:bactofilin family protein n=1 Tax=Roseiflexus sp. TaxID=2562120 RepID=UPI00398AAB7D